MSIDRADTYEDTNKVFGVKYRKLDTLIEAIEFALRKGWKFTDEKIAELERDEEFVGQMRAASISRGGSQASGSPGRSNPQSPSPSTPQRSPFVRGGQMSPLSPSLFVLRTTPSTPSVAPSQLAQFPRGE